MRRCFDHLPGQRTSPPSSSWQVFKILFPFSFMLVVVCARDVIPPLFIRPSSPLCRMLRLPTFDLSFFSATDSASSPPAGPVSSWLSVHSITICESPLFFHRRKLPDVSPPPFSPHTRPIALPACFPPYRGMCLPAENVPLECPPSIPLVSCVYPRRSLRPQRLGFFDFSAGQVTHVGPVLT